MLMADTMAIFFVILGLLLALPGLWVLCRGLWPRAVAKAAELCGGGVRQFRPGGKDRGCGDGLSISNDRELRCGRIGHRCWRKISRAFRKYRSAATVAGDVAWRRCARIGIFIADSRMVRDLAGGGDNRLRRESALVAADVSGVASSVRTGACVSR